MEEEEGDRELRYVCKLCDKRYPCGKSLGGHMRSHVIAESDQKFEPTMKPAIELGGPSGYGLRENPKKTWRAVDSTSPLPQQKVCKQCGKGFQSLKALCGHMACHSDKDRVLKDDHSWTSENSFSDTEVEEDQRRQTRSKNKRYNNRIVVRSSFSLVNGSSSVSEIDEQEQEEVAMCLMMLSRDSGNRSVVESSDNNSVVLETRSSSIDTLKMKRKLKSSVFDGESVQFENSYSGYFRNGSKKVDSDISVDEKYMAAKSSNGAKVEVFNAELRKDLMSISKYDSQKRTELGEESSKKAKNGSFDVEQISNNAHKRSKFECLNCNKTFSSPQGLGGHRPCHKKINAAFASRHEIRENSVEGDNNKPKAKDWYGNAEKRIRPKKTKGHECPICLRIFKSGQALGGHKRSHFIGGSEDRINQTPVISQEVIETPDLIDLNLPAPVEDETDEFPQFI